MHRPGFDFYVFSADVLHRCMSAPGSGIPAVHGLVTNLALGVAPLLERQTSRHHLIFGPAIGTFEDGHRFTIRLRLMM